MWIGPRESDIINSRINFYRSVTYNGSNQNNNTSFTSQTQIRIDHNNASASKLREYICNQLSQLLDDPCVHFMFYNPMQSYSMGKDIVDRTICNNGQALLEFFRSKSNAREFAHNYIPVVPYIEFEGANLPETSFRIGSKKNYILQKVCSSGGNGTLKMSRSDCIQYIQRGSRAEKYIISPFLENAAPINVHVVIFKDKCIVLPPSFQLINHNGLNFTYIGGDFHTNLTIDEYKMILDRTIILGEELRKLGFRGVCGFDYMLTQSDLLFLEMNPRFQASSFLLNTLLVEKGTPSLHELNILAFSEMPAPIESFLKFDTPKSFFTVNGEVAPLWYSEITNHLPSIISGVVLDGFQVNMRAEPNAYLFRIIANRNLCWRNYDYQLNLAPNILKDTLDWQEKVIQLEPLTVKIGLLNQGIVFSTDAMNQMEKIGRSIRQGVFQSIDLFLSMGLIVNAPYHTDFSELSPYKIDYVDNSFVLVYNQHILCPISFDAEDPYRNNVASEGTLFRNITFWATDRLRIHHQLRCQFKANGVGCHFCNVRPKVGAFSINDVCEAIDFYLDHADFRHFLIGGGSGSEPEERENILHIARHIRAHCDKPIYVMCLPPKDLSVLEEYHAAGINEIGFNLELFDRNTAQTLMPGKGSIPLSRYEQAYQSAVHLWGKNGNVRSLMVLGLESLESFYSGIEWLCKLGVMPIISIFRPLNNITLKNAIPYGNEDLLKIYLHTLEITAKYNLFPGPYCIACQNNTLSLPFR